MLTLQLSPKQWEEVVEVGINLTLSLPNCTSTRVATTYRTSTVSCTMTSHLNSTCIFTPCGSRAASRVVPSSPHTPSWSSCLLLALVDIWWAAWDLLSGHLSALVRSTHTCSPASCTTSDLTIVRKQLTNSAAKTLSSIRIGSAKRMVLGTHSLIKLTSIFEIHGTNVAPRKDLLHYHSFSI